MGMFDWVDFEMDCPLCGTHMEEFQTKDLDNTLSFVKISKVNSFYDVCPRCGLWITFVVKKQGKHYIFVPTIEIDKKKAKSYLVQEAL